MLFLSPENVNRVHASFRIFRLPAYSCQLLRTRRKPLSARLRDTRCLPTLALPPCPRPLPMKERDRRCWRHPLPTRGSLPCSIAEGSAHTNSRISICPLSLTRGADVPHVDQHTKQHECCPGLITPRGTSALGLGRARTALPTAAV